MKPNLTQEQIETNHWIVERVKAEARLQRTMASKHARNAATQAVNHPFDALEQMNKSAQYTHCAEVLEHILAGL